MLDPAKPAAGSCWTKRQTYTKKCLRKEDSAVVPVAKMSSPSSGLGHKWDAMFKYKRKCDGSKDKTCMLLV